MPDPVGRRPGPSDSNESRLYCAVGQAFGPIAGFWPGVAQNRAPALLCRSPPNRRRQDPRYRV
jgi:hypothetical protein